MRTLIKDIEIINEGDRFLGYVLINGELIEKVGRGKCDIDLSTVGEVVDGCDKILLPGAIDDQVHFRQPGLTQKADIASESAAAVAGGVTSFMEMPNTKPQTTTLEALDEKFMIGANNSVANYSFYIGATNDNIDVVKSVDYRGVCGIKLFMGSSTGNMLVDNEKTLSELFEAAPAIITAHCEDEDIVKRNMSLYRERYGDDVPWKCHGEIRSSAACYKSSLKAATLARRYGARLHILHLSTAQELDVLDKCDRRERKITGEVCVHHLWFDDSDYESKKQWIKWNPSIKTREDRDALREAVKNGMIEVVATDHAPHTIEEKMGNYFTTPSGAPMVQHSLVAMLELADKGLWNYETVVEMMCHRPADLFDIVGRGYIREGYKADLVVVERSAWTVEKSNLKYKCKWSPMDGVTFGNKIVRTYVNGSLAYSNGVVDTTIRGQRLMFNR